MKLEPLYRVRFRYPEGWSVALGAGGSLEGQHFFLAEGRCTGRVAGRFRMRGTHNGTLFGIPATGKPVDVGVMVIACFDETGKWVEDWASWDQVGMMQQIGVIAG